MPHLNHYILKDVFYEIIKRNDYRHIDKFMMSGREPFELVIDICQRATMPVFFSHKIVAQLPNVVYNPIIGDDSDEDSDDEDYADKSVIGTEIVTYNSTLIKPISIALAATITSLDLRGFTSSLIPMLKSIDRGILSLILCETIADEALTKLGEMIEVNICDSDRQLKAILEACVNIPNVRDGVTIRLGTYFDFASGMTAFAIPCRKLTIKRAYFNTMYHPMNVYNPHLHNIRDLTIQGRFRKTCTIHKELKEFVAFLSANFPKLETLNIFFLLKVNRDYYWNWNDSRMANFFKSLPFGIKGCICFKIVNEELDEINRSKYPDVQKSDEEFYKIFSVTNNLSFKLAYWYEARQVSFSDFDYDGYSS